MDGAGNVPPEMGHFECPKLRATTTAPVVSKRKEGLRSNGAPSRKEMNIRSPRFLGKRVIIERVNQTARRQLAETNGHVLRIQRGPRTARGRLSAKFIGNGN